ILHKFHAGVYEHLFMRRRKNFVSEHILIVLRVDVKKIFSVKPMPRRNLIVTAALPPRAPESHSGR
ncbi:MAG: hypothetical protein LBC94_04655, partial [Desulfovibrio sp.]|nr:hypothetical protein [Desulfovibrio sp.]